VLYRDRVGGFHFVYRNHEARSGIRMFVHHRMAGDNRIQEDTCIKDRKGAVRLKPAPFLLSDEAQTSWETGKGY